MKSSILYACLAVAGLLAAACGGSDPASTCRSQCQEAIAGGCLADGTDCEAQCSGAQRQYDDAVADAEVAGCSAQFNTAYSCLSGGDVCDTTRCNTEVSAYSDCYVAFCTANPMSEACAP